jgi:hypothetical protein
MKLIIAGGRSYNLTDKDYERLDALHAKYHVTEVVCGTPWDPEKDKEPEGADQCGAAWGHRNKILVKDFPPAWDDITRPGAVVRRRRDGKQYDAPV